MDSNEKVVHTGYDSAKVLGIDVQFSKILGDTIVENFIKSLSEDDMKLITDYISKDLFEEFHKYNLDNSGYEEALSKRVKESWKENKPGSYYSTYEVVSVGDQIKSMFNQRIKEELQTKIEEIVKTADYQEKVDKMAQEIVDYSIEGYKEDLKNSIREKMINNVMNNAQTYGGIPLRTIIREEIENYSRQMIR